MADDEEKMIEVIAKVMAALVQMVEADGQNIVEAVGNVGPVEKFEEVNGLSVAEIGSEDEEVDEGLGVMVSQ